MRDLLWHLLVLLMCPKNSMVPSWLEMITTTSEKSRQKKGRSIARVCENLHFFKVKRCFLANRYQNSTSTNSPLIFIPFSRDLPNSAGIECKFIEQWHQKLHTNSAPDDIAICEGARAAVQQRLQRRCWKWRWTDSLWTTHVTLGKSPSFNGETQYFYGNVQ